MTTEYLRLAPAECLRDWVSEIWVQRHPVVEQSASPTRVLPSGMVDLVINRGDPFLLAGPSGPVPLPRAHVVGTLSRPISVLATGTTDLIVARLFPWALLPLFGLPASELADRVVGTRALGRAAWLDELGESGDPGALDRLLTGLIQRMHRADLNAVAVAAVKVIGRSGGRASVSRVAAEIGVGRRHLARVFGQCVGHGPKLAASVARFQAALRLMQEGRRGSRLASDAGYSDQPHMIRSFVRHGALTPGQVSRVSPSLLHRRFNQTRSMSHFFNTAYL